MNKVKPGAKLANLHISKDIKTILQLFLPSLRPLLNLSPPLNLFPFLPF